MHILLLCETYGDLPCLVRPIIASTKEATMQLRRNNPAKTIIDREKLMTLKTCAACNHPFNLGDPVVLACGAWDGPPKLIHEKEAVFDVESGGYVERKCYSAKLGRG